MMCAVVKSAEPVRERKAEGDGGGQEVKTCYEGINDPKERW